MDEQPGPANIYRKRRDLPLAWSDSDMEEEFQEVLRCARFGSEEKVANNIKHIPDMIDCLSIKSSILPQEEPALLEMEPVTW